MKVIINESSVVKVLERVWGQDPYFDGDKLKMFGISPKNPSAQMLFQKFIGLEEMTKRAENIMKDLNNKDFNVDNCGTYDIDFKIYLMLWMMKKLLGKLEVRLLNVLRTILMKTLSSERKLV